MVSRRSNLLNSLASVSDSAGFLLPHFINFAPTDYYEAFKNDASQKDMKVCDGSSN